MVVEKTEKHSLEDAKETTAAVRQLSQGALLPMLLDMTVTGGIEPAAQEYYNQESSVSAMAIVTKSMIGRIVGNLIIGMSSAVIPTRLFGDDDSALKWLHEQPRP